MEAFPRPDLPIRAADWRFLLPPSRGRFGHLVLLGGSSDLAELLVRLDVARRVSVALTCAEPADAVVMLAHAPESLDDAVRSLAGDGVLYCEIDRRRARHVALTPRRRARQLRRLELHPGATYCVSPGFPSRDMYLSGDNRAVQWYLDSLYRSRTGPRRALKAALQSLASSGMPLQVLAPCYAMTAQRGTAPAPPAVVAAACAVLGWEPRNVRAVFLAHGDAESNRIAVVLFERHARRPAAVAKFARQPAFNARVESEHRCLTEIRSVLNASLRDSVPSSALTDSNGLAVAVQTCVPGATLRSRIRGDGRGLLDDLRLVSEWLGDFHRTTTIDTPPAREWLARRLVGGLCAEYEARFDLTSAERTLFGAVAARVDALGMVRLPIVWQHTDFGPWNIYRHGPRLSVIDWEWARQGPAVADLLFFATHWSAEAAKIATPAERATHVEHLFCSRGPATPLTAAVDRAIATYMRQLHVPGALVPLLLVYTVLERALLHTTSCPGAGPTHAAYRASNRHVGDLTTLARHVNGLFPMEPVCAA